MNMKYWAIHLQDSFIWHPGQGHDVVIQIQFKLVHLLTNGQIETIKNTIKKFLNLNTDTE